MNEFWPYNLLIFYVIPFQLSISDHRATKAENMALQYQRDKEKILKEKNSLQVMLRRCRARNLKNKNKPLSKKEKLAVVKEALASHFTDAQINAFCRPNMKRSRQWTEEDIRGALTLRALSRSAYKYLRTKKIVPLPGLSTLSRYFRDFKISPGYLSCLQEMLKIKAVTLTLRQRVVCLSFDEVHVKGNILYDNQWDQIVGPHKEANVMLMRGLFHKYKLPIWFRHVGPKFPKNSSFLTG